MNAVKMIEPWQITKMWAISKAIAMDKDDLYALASVGSLHEMDSRQAQEVIARLESMQGAYTPPQKPSPPKTHSEVAGMATEGQQRKAWALMYELRKYDAPPSTAALGDRLCGIIQKELKTNATAQKPFAWLDFKATNKLIEVLKKYVANAKKRGGGDG